MMNVLALSLVLSSLAAAGVWSPTPQREDVIVKDGHRVIVVEYDENGKHNTKVSISQPPAAKQTVKEEETASVLPNLGQGISGRQYPASAAGELICDAFGKCTNSIATVFGKAKDKVSENAYEAKENVKDKVTETASKNKVSETKDRVGNFIGKAKEEANRKGLDVKENANKAKDTAKETAKAVGDHIVSNATDLITMILQAPLMSIANLAGLATAYGMSVWVTFISSYVLAGVLPRQQFGVVQSKMYPVYFRAMAYSIGLALLAHILGHRKTLFSSSTNQHMFQAFNLLLSLIMVLANALYLEPKATKVMFERMKMEKEEGRGRDDLVGEGRKTCEPPSVTNPAAPMASPSEQEAVIRSKITKLNDRLKKLNAKSSLLNVLTLMALTWHLVYLDQNLSINC